MDRTIGGKASAACGLLCVLCALVPSTTPGWSQATHAYIADQIGARAGHDDLAELWGIVAPDLFIFVFDGDLCPGWVSDQTHGVTDPGSFRKLWDAAGTDRERALARGFVAHNQQWGADYTAHISRLTGGPDGGYVIRNATTLLNTASSLGAPGRTFDDELAALGIPAQLRPDVAHLVTEYAIDIRLANDVDPLLGRKLARSARGETKALSGLLARSFAAGYSVACPTFAGDEAAAASVLVAAEEQHRKNMIFLGQAISKPEDVAVQLLAAEVASLFPLLGLQPDPERAVEVVEAGVLASMKICSDYAAEIEATVDFVAQNLRDNGFDAQERPRPVLEDELIRELSRSGLELNPGYAMVYGNACKQYTYPALHSCFGNNPAAPYVIPVVKAWPDETVGPTPVDAFGQVSPGFVPTYRLGVRDAIVIYGRMPPAGKYLSVTTYAWTQHGSWKAKDYERWASTPNHAPMRYVFSTIPPDDPGSGRFWSFSTLGDPVNNVEMAERSGDPFGKDRYFIITPSGSTDRAVRDALHAQGVPDGDIFTEKIPRRDAEGPIGPLGMGENAIEFFTFFRYVLPNDPAEGRRWWESLRDPDPPLHVLRVRAPPSAGPVERYDLLTYGARSAQSEAYLADDFHTLVTAVCDRVRTATGLQSSGCAESPPAASFMADPLRDFGWAGPYCRKVNMWCGDQTDAGLFLTGPLPLDTGQVYAVVSTLATETGNATYVGLSINDASTYLAPSGVLHTDLQGSARAFAATRNDPDKFFVHFYTRDCGVLDGVLPIERRRDCTTIDEEMVPKQGSTNALGDPTLFGMFWPGIRNYIAPGTSRGPDTAKMLTPRILEFSR